jgi:hypothetical protein
MELPINYEQAHWARRKAARVQYMEDQEQKCHHCGNPLDGEPTRKVLNQKINMRFFPKGFLDNPVHLHHNHRTGMTIGAVHAYCNAVLWQFHGE